MHYFRGVRNFIFRNVHVLPSYVSRLPSIELLPVVNIFRAYTPNNIPTKPGTIPITPCAAQPPVGN